MTAPIALQLYTLRKVLAKEYEAGVRKIAAMGYVGVEADELPGNTPQKASQLFKDLGLIVTSMHDFPIPDQHNLGRIVETCGILGCRRVVSGGGDEDYQDPESIKRTCDRFNQAATLFAPHGITLGIHNHWVEFQKVEGRLAYEIMLDYLVPEVFFQVDTYWARVAGADPAEVVKKLGMRAPLLHIKDGPLSKRKPQTAVGEGKMDFPAIVQASAGSIEWMIVEMDDCATDMLEAVEKSYHYLVRNGLAQGKK